MAGSCRISFTSDTVHCHRDCFRLGGLDFWMIQPGGSELPARRELQGIVAFRAPDLFLEIPHVLQEEGLLFHFVFVADNIAQDRSAGM